MTEEQERTAVVAEARTWIGTPYHGCGAIKGVGVDCARILVEVWANCGLIDRFDPGSYPTDWHYHRNEEMYLGFIERHTGRVDEGEFRLVNASSNLYVQPGDLLLWKIGKVFSHSAIVTEWPNVVHAIAADRYVLETPILHHALNRFPMRIYSFWRKP
jgi:cell wall-associated NlpC family hydrolase